MEKLVIDRTQNIDIIRKACDRVREYMIKQKLILYGGQAIDYALHIYGEHLYEDYETPDYDFYSPNNVIDIYNLFKSMVDEGFVPLAALPAYHLNTMRLRIFSNDMIADSSFISKDLYHLNKRVSLNYKGIRLRHPYMQYADQHRALAYPFEVVGASTTILFRYQKDFERFKLLLSKYPIEIGNSITEKFLSKLSYPDSKTVLEYPVYSLKKTKSFPIKLTMNKGVNCGINAYILYLSVISGQPVPKECYVAFPNSVVSTEKQKGKGIKMKEDMIYKQYITGDSEIITNKHRLGTQTINKHKVVSANYLVIYLYAMITNSYKIGKPTENQVMLMSMYLNMIRWIGLVYNMDKLDDKIKVFMPSIDMIGEELPNKLREKLNQDRELSNKLIPKAIYYREDVDKKEMFKTIPTSFKYDKIFGFE